MEPGKDTPSMSFLLMVTEHTSLGRVIQNSICRGNYDNIRSESGLVSTYTPAQRGRSSSHCSLYVRYKSGCERGMRISTKR